MKCISCLLVVFFCLIFLSSCDKDQIRQFSCDPSIDEFVKENSLELSGIDIFELALYDIEVQRAIFRSWGHGKKREAWIEKLQFVMANEQNQIINPVGKGRGSHNLKESKLPLPAPILKGGEVTKIPK
jgi:hypothetical protein